MKLKTRPFVHFAPVPGGVYFSGPTSQFAMKGPEPLTLMVDRMLPMLDEGTTETEIVEALGTETARPAVRAVTRALSQHGMLIDVDALTVQEPPPAERERHREVIALLESRSDDPYAAYQRLRSSSVLLGGPAAVVAPMARGLFRHGIGRLVLVPSDDDADLARTGERIGARIGTHGEASSCDAAVVLADELPMMATGAGIVVPLVRRGTWAWVGPVGSPSDAEALLADVTRRLEAQAKDRSWPEGTGPVRDALLGSLAVQLLVEELAGVRLPGDAYLVHGDDHLATRVELPAPVTEDESADDVPAAIRRFTDDYFGPFSLVRDDDLPQVPLCLREIRVVGTAERIVAWGEDQRTATIAAIVSAARSSVSAAEATPVAGTCRATAIVDGLLRLAEPEAVENVSVPGYDDRTREIRAVLGSHHDQVAVARLPGTHWHRARVSAGGAGGVRVGAWGRGPQEAVREAYGAAWAATISGVRHEGSAAATRVLLTMTESEVAAAAEQLERLHGHVRLREASDPLLGRGGLVFGHLAPCETTP